MTTQTFDTNALLDLLYDAQEYLNTAIDKLDEYVQKSGDHAAKAYILDHLKVMTSRDHNFLGRDLNIDDLIARLKAFDAEEDAEEE